MKGHLVTVDPGYRDAGMAWFVDGKLRGAAYVEDSAPPRPTVEQWAWTAGLIWSHAQRWVDGNGPYQAFVEHMQVYPGDPVPPADLLKVQSVTAAAAVLLRTLPRMFEVTTEVPAKWKGQVPKKIHHQRVWASLEPEEGELLDSVLLAVHKDKVHNVMDAVAMGLWCCKRKLKSG